MINFFFGFCLCTNTHTQPQSINIHHKNVLCIKTGSKIERGLKFNRQQNIVPEKIGKAKLYGLAVPRNHSLCQKPSLFSPPPQPKIIDNTKKVICFRFLVSFSLAYFTFHQRNTFVRRVFVFVAMSGDGVPFSFSFCGFYSGVSKTFQQYC